MRFLPSSKQIIFDWAIEYFSITPSRCVVPGTGCVYLRSDERRCVIGSMLEPETDRDVMFMLRFFGPIREILDTLERVEVRNMSGVSWVLGDPQAKLLLTEIQAVHDRPSFWDEPYGLSVFGWNQLGLICSKYQLSDRLLEEKRNL